ncbi:MAG: c-type cytochrome [Mariprofundaceae bacterium]|nr:c-type cytochrome [Mariprofundaceae bacterium]
MCLLLTGYVHSAVAAEHGDALRGKAVAHVRCLPCHHLHQSSRGIGPSLQGIFNRAPSISGVPFSHWDASALDVWLKGPRLIKPNTEMSIPPMSERDRTDVIAYLRDAKKDETGRD